MNQDNNGIPICDKSNGTCKGGCLDGYIPPLCNDCKFLIRHVKKQEQMSDVIEIMCM